MPSAFATCLGSLAGSSMTKVILQDIGRTLREHAILIATICLYGLAMWWVVGHYKLPYRFAPNMVAYAQLLYIPLALALSAHVLYVMVFIRPHRLVDHLQQSLKPYFSLRRVLLAAPVLLLFPLFASTFTFFKSAIPAINPYVWDATLMHLDGWLHGGVQPWVLLQPILGYPVVTGAINVLYNLWFFVAHGMFVLLAFTTSRPEIRMRYLLSYTLSWIVLGTLGAIAFASMGPCFSPEAERNGVYAPLMNYLMQTNETIPVWSLDVQQFLWDAYQQNRIGMGSGISAMPSLHVAVATLMAITGWQFSRRWGIALTAYALIIFLGSIHLGWHYAVDGYMGAIGAWGIWWLVGGLLSKGQSFLLRTSPKRVGL